MACALSMSAGSCCAQEEEKTAPKKGLFGGLGTQRLRAPEPEEEPAPANPLAALFQRGKARPSPRRHVSARRRLWLFAYAICSTASGSSAQKLERLQGAVWRKRRVSCVRLPCRECAAADIGQLHHRPSFLWAVATHAAQCHSTRCIAASSARGRPCDKL